MHFGRDAAGGLAAEYYWHIRSHRGALGGLYAMQHLEPNVVALFYIYA